jgi:hypothetical protein
MAGDLSRLAEDIGTALLDWARSSSSSESDTQWKRGGRTEIIEGDDHLRGVCVNKDDTLIFDPSKPELDLPLRVVAHALNNASDHCNKIATYLREHDAAVGEHGRKPREYYTMIRLAATMHTSLKQLAKLIQGEDLEENIANTDVLSHWRSNDGGFAAQLDHVLGSSVQEQARAVDREEDERLGLDIVDAEEEITGRSRMTFDLPAKVAFAADPVRALKEIRKYAVMGLDTTDPQKKTDYFDYINEIAITVTGEPIDGQHEGD